MRPFFGTVPLTTVDWIDVAPFSIAAPIAMEFTRIYIRRRKANAVLTTDVLERYPPGYSLPREGVVIITTGGARRTATPCFCMDVGEGTSEYYVTPVEWAYAGRCERLGERVRGVSKEYLSILP